MMCSIAPLVLVALSVALAAPASPYDNYPVVVPEKRAALVLDRLLIALQKALHDSPQRLERPADGPRAAALRFDDDLVNIALPVQVLLIDKRVDLRRDHELAALQQVLMDHPPRYGRPSEEPRFASLRISDGYIGDMSDRISMVGEHPDEWLGPEDLRVAPLRTPTRELTDMTGLQRRGQTGGGAAGLRGRVLRCYFNAITCF